MRFDFGEISEFRTMLELMCQEDDQNIDGYCICECYATASLSILPMETAYYLESKGIITIRVLKFKESLKINEFMKQIDEEAKLWDSRIKKEST